MTSQELRPTSAQKPLFSIGRHSDSVGRFANLTSDILYIFAGTEESTMDHTILCLAPKNIVAVTKTNLKIDPNIIIKDWEQRQMPR